MGIYTNFTSDYSYDNVPERNLFEECGETATFEEMALNLVAESENNYAMIMKAVALDELAYLEETGEEIIYESGGVSGFLKKVKEFFIKLIEKVRQLLHTFLTKLASFVKSDKDFASKYKKEFATKWGAVKNDFEFKGYVFTIKSPSAQRDQIKTVYRTAIVDGSNLQNDQKEALNAFIDSGDTTKLFALESGNKTNIENTIKKIVDEMRDDADDDMDVVRGAVAKEIQKECSSLSTQVSDPLTAAEFSKELFESFRNGESTKEGIEKSKLSVSEIVGALETSDKMRSAAEKACNATTNGIKDVIKILETAEKKLVKLNTSKDTDKEDSNILSQVLAAVSMIIDGLKSTSNLYVQGKGIYLQAITDRSRQSKAIMVKVIGGSKKLKESYNYDDNNSFMNEGTSFLSSVNLK